jgi:hypothetical protein
MNFETFGWSESTEPRYVVYQCVSLCGLPGRNVVSVTVLPRARAGFATSPISDDIKHLIFSNLCTLSVAFCRNDKNEEAGRSERLSARHQQKAYRCAHTFSKHTVDGQYCFNDDAL